MSLLRSQGQHLIETLGIGRACARGQVAHLNVSLMCGCKLHLLDRFGHAFAVEPVLENALRLRSAQLRGHVENVLRALDVDLEEDSLVPGPVLETAGGPLLLFAMPGGHVTGLGGGARPVTSGMTRHLALSEVNLYQMITGPDFHRLAHLLVRHRVMMLVELDVVIDIDPATPDLDVLIKLFR